MPQLLIKKMMAYAYEELSQAAKEKAKSWFCYDYDPTDPDMISELMKDEIREHQYDPDSVELSWSLNYCQGDGVSLEGKIHPSNLLKLVERFFPRDLLKVRQIKRFIEEDIFCEPIKFTHECYRRGVSINNYRVNYHDGIAREDVEYKIAQWGDEEVLEFFQQLPEDSRGIRTKELEQTYVRLGDSDGNSFDSWLEQERIVDHFVDPIHNKFFAFVGDAVMPIEMKIPSRFLNQTEYRLVEYLAEEPSEMRQALQAFYFNKANDEIDALADSLWDEIGKAIAEDIKELERKLEKLGYAELEYQTSEEQLIETAKNENWLFDEQGKRISSDY